jgi:tagatose 1,6-diphosphate aldolase GatY/KbaY
MLVSIADLLGLAVRQEFAIGAFNIYNMEGALAVVRAAEAVQGPAILQLHPAAFRQSPSVLTAMCKAAAENAKVPISLHLDHATSHPEIKCALEKGFSSVMFDGSSLPVEENLQRTRAVAVLAHEHGAVIEAELGRLTGSEDGLGVPDYEEKLTDPNQAAQFRGGNECRCISGSVLAMFTGERESSRYSISGALNKYATASMFRSCYMAPLD